MPLAQQALMELQLDLRAGRGDDDDRPAGSARRAMIDWFIEGAFRPEGFDQNWEEQARIVGSYTSITHARAWFERAVAAARDKVAAMSDDELMVPLPDGPIMGGAPRMAILGAINDRTAHHRGALTVYARLSGIVPLMPYMEM